MTRSNKSKLLFLASPFPPYPSIGAIRTWNIARYLVRLGWDVTVVTPHPSVWRHAENVQETGVRITHAGIQRVLTDHSWRCLDPEILKCRNKGLSWVAGGVCRQIARRLGIDTGIGWAKAAERACSTLDPNDVDVILATGAPFVSFTLAKRLSDKLGRPYVLDYRDPWTGNPHDNYPVRSAVEKKEAKLIAECAAVTIVSPSWASAMDLRFGIGAKLHVITNGYDPDELAAIKPYQFGHFAIVYTGKFYPPKRVISPVMAALKHLEATPNRHAEWFFHYYGPHEEHVRNEAIRFGLTDRVVLHGTVTRAEALSAVRGAGVAVVITSVTENVSSEDKGIVPGKVFETIGLGSPTVFIAPAGSDVETIAETTGLARRFAGSDIDSISSFLVEAMNGQVPRLRKREMYAWTAIATKLDSLLRSVASRPISASYMNRPVEVG